MRHPALRRLLARDAIGRLFVFPSGLVSGVVQVPWWDARELPKIVDSFGLPHGERQQ